MQALYTTWIYLYVTKKKLNNSLKNVKSRSDQWLHSDEFLFKCYPKNINIQTRPKTQRVTFVHVANCVFTKTYPSNFVVWVATWCKNILGTTRKCVFYYKVVYLSAVKVSTCHSISVKGRDDVTQADIY